MRKSVPIFSCLFLMSFNCYAVNTTTLTTWYPPPSAAYNQVKLATNTVAASTTPAVYCTAGNLGIFLNSTTNTLYQCTGTAGAANPYCPTVTNGTLLADNTGTLHVCMNGIDTIYPEQCYNAFCSFDTSTGAASCAVPATCAPGYTQQYVNASSSCSDTFQTSVNTWITSIVCCSSNTTAACVGCTPTTCAALGDNCGTPPNGCGGTLAACGNCSGVNTCGGGGTPFVCGCTPLTICPPGDNCGTIPNGCGGTVTCGPACTSPSTCVSNICGCTPISCGGASCGQDGCGNNCGTGCQYGYVCTTTTTPGSCVCPGGWSSCSGAYSCCYNPAANGECCPGANDPCQTLPICTY